MTKLISAEDEKKLKGVLRQTPEEALREILYERNKLPTEEWRALRLKRMESNVR
jgi:hypothetical protein